MAKDKSSTNNSTDKKSRAKPSLAVNILDPNGESTGKFNLSKDIFQRPVSPMLLAQAIRVYQINQRKGTASTKTRSEVSGSTRKIYRQKGTGRARHGDIKAPIFVGGGIVGGPKPKKYQRRLNKKQKRLAMIGALSFQFRHNNLLVLSDKFSTIETKTKVLKASLQKLGLDKLKVLLVAGNSDQQQKTNLYLASRSLNNVDYVNLNNLNPYMLIRAEKVAILNAALVKLQRLLEKKID